MAGPPRNGLTALRHATPACARYCRLSGVPGSSAAPGPITAKPTEYPQRQMPHSKPPVASCSRPCCSRAPARGRARARHRHARHAEAPRRASPISPTSIPMRPRAAGWCSGARHLRQPQPVHHQGRHARRPARVRVREPAGAQRRRAVHAVWPDRRERRGARRPQLDHFHLRPEARFSDGAPDHARRRPLQPRRC